MKANKFVKEFGWGCAYDLWQGVFPLYENNMCILNGCVCTLNSDFLFNLLDLKNLISSWELVQEYGGLHMAKADVMDLDGWEKTSPYWVKIKQAIKDVESCL